MLRNPLFLAIGVHTYYKHALISIWIVILIPTAAWALIKERDGGVTSSVPRATRWVLCKQTWPIVMGIQRTLLPSR